MGLCAPSTHTSHFWHWLAIYEILSLLARPGNSEVSMLPCSNLSVESGAVYRTTDKRLQDVIRVECHQGHVLQGQSELTCVNGYTDKSRLPTCFKLVPCPANFTLQNGRAFNTSELVTGSSLHFSCDAHYNLTTSYRSVTCTRNGTFDKPYPACRSTGLPCRLTEGFLKSSFLSSQNEGVFRHGDAVTVRCEHGYYMKEERGYLNTTCSNGRFTKRLDDICHFVGFNHILINGSNAVTSNTGTLTFDKGKEIYLTCRVCSNTTDGLPLPQLTWVFPPKLRDYVEVDSTDTFMHTTYINKYSTIYDAGRYHAEGILRINPTLDVHRGAYTCHVRLVNVTQSYQAVINIRTRYEVAMWCLITLPIVLFLAIHCFYRKATNINPFPDPNKLSKHMLQDDGKGPHFLEHEKKKKLDELRNLHRNPVYQKSPGTGRARRGAVIDL